MTEARLAQGRLGQDMRAQVKREQVKLGQRVVAKREEGWQGWPAGWGLRLEAGWLEVQGRGMLQWLQLQARQGWQLRRERATPAARGWTTQGHWLQVKVWTVQALGLRLDCRAAAE